MLLACIGEQGRDGATIRGLILLSGFSLSWPKTCAHHDCHDRAARARPCDGAATAADATGQHLIKYGDKVEGPAAPQRGPPGRGSQAPPETPTPRRFWRRGVDCF